MNSEVCNDPPNDVVHFWCAFVGGRHSRRRLRSQGNQSFQRFHERTDLRRSGRYRFCRIGILAAERLDRSASSAERLDWGNTYGCHGHHGRAGSTTRTGSAATTSFSTSRPTTSSFARGLQDRHEMLGLDLCQTGRSGIAGPLLSQERHPRHLGQRLLRVRYEKSLVDPDRQLPLGSPDGLQTCSFRYAQDCALHRG